MILKLIVENKSEVEAKRIVAKEFKVSTTPCIGLG